MGCWGGGELMQLPVPGVRPLLGAPPVPHERGKKEVGESHL